MKKAGECISFPRLCSKKMKNINYSGLFAGQNLIFSFRQLDTARYFNGWLKPTDQTIEDLLVRVPKSDCDCWIKEYGRIDNGNTEFGMSVYRASDKLLRFNCCLIHGAAILWRGKSWIFCADSGTGKSTQVKHWLTLYPNEMKIMNGDKPILRIEEDGSITVHPSPWKGKEGWGDDMISAPLGGIIVLKQTKYNRISQIGQLQCTARILSFFFSSFETEQTIRMLCRFEEKLFENVQIWRLENLGDFDSARMTHDFLLENS